VLLQDPAKHYIQDAMIRVAEMAETLKIRIHYGIKEELFDLVLRLDNVARVRARILFNAGYHTTTKVKKENPYVLHRKTGLGVNICKKIIKRKQSNQKI
jgi:helicase